MSELPWQRNFFIAIGVFPVELLACQVSMICTAIALIAVISGLTCKRGERVNTALY